MRFPFNFSIILLIFAIISGCTTPGDSKIIANKIPLIGFNSQAKAIVPETMLYEDINYFVYCPVLTGFADSSSGIIEGQQFQQPFLNTNVLFTAASFDDGINGIPSGVRYTGLLADGSGSIVIEFETATGNFWFEEKIYLDDPFKIILSTHTDTSKTIIYSAMQGVVTDDNSGIATTTMAFYTVLGSGLQIMGLVPQGEYYFGPWSSIDNTLFGSGLSFTRSIGIINPANAYAGVNKPTGVPDSANIDQTVEYIKAFVSTNPALSAQYALFFKTTTDEHPTQYLTGIWNGVTIDSSEKAKENLPSDIWKSISQLDTF